MKINFKQYNKQDKGITLIALVITIIIMLILASVTIEFAGEQIEKAQLEDLKTTMLLIKGRAQIVADKESFGEDYDNSGMIKLADATRYNMTDLQNIFNNIDTSNLYIWEQPAMDNNNIQVTITNTEFFVIDYATGEVYYSKGYTYEGNKYYSLTDMQDI